MSRLVTPCGRAACSGRWHGVARYPAAAAARTRRRDRRGRTAPRGGRRWHEGLAAAAPSALRRRLAPAAAVCPSSGPHHAVAVVHCNHQLLEEPAGLVFGQPPPGGHVTEQVPTLRVLHGKHQVRLRKEDLQQGGGTAGVGRCLRGRTRGRGCWSVSRAAGPPATHAASPSTHLLQRDDVGVPQLDVVDDLQAGGERAGTPASAGAEQTDGGAHGGSTTVRRRTAAPAGSPCSSSRHPPRVPHTWRCAAAGGGG